MYWMTQNDLEHHKVKVTPNICYCVPALQIHSITIFELQAIPKWPWTLQGQKYMYTIYSLLVSHIVTSFTPFYSAVDRFWPRSFSGKTAPNDPKMILEHYTQKDTS